MSFSLRLLGGASIEGSDGPLTGRAAQRHRLALLAMLATSPRGGITRDKLIAYLWPESGEERARRSLSDSVYRISKALGEDTVITVGDELRLDHDRLPSDVSEFQEAVEGREWERAVDAYAGPLLDGFHLPHGMEFERWLDAERDRLARLYADALESLADEKSAEGDLAAAAATWQRRAALDPFDSRVALHLMTALEAAGNRAGALQHARIHAQLLEGEFGTGPDPEVLALAEQIRARSAEGRSPGVKDPQVGDVTPGASRTVTLPPRSGSGSDRPLAAKDHGVEAEDQPVELDEASAAIDGAADEDRSRAVVSISPVEARRSASSRLWQPSLVLGIAVLAALGWWLFGPGGTSSSPTDTPGIAVLPFENLGDDDESPYFADGVTEDVLTHLSRVGDLRVIAHASVVAYRGSNKPVPEIAGELGVRYLLRGSVRRANDHVRITAQLVDATANANVWAQTYDRRLEDIFAVQGDIAKEVADALEAELTPSVAAEIDRPPTTDLEAYNAYLRGRYFWHRRTEEALRRSARFFEQAVERDSGFARAWAGLADAYSVMAFYDYLPPGEAYPRAKRAALRALALDDALAEAHASLGYITLYYDWDAEKAEAAFRRAIELNPSYSVGHQWYANHLVATGRFEEAGAQMSRAREVNPLSLIANLALGWVYYYAGRYEEAVRQCSLALEMSPDWDLAFLWRGLALEELGRAEEAIGSLERAVTLSGGSGITVAALAHAHAASGSPERARALLAGLIDATAEGRYQPSFEIAKVYVALEEPDEAIRWLEHAFEEHAHSMVFLEVDPQLAPLRREPAFRSLVGRVGLAGS